MVVDSLLIKQLSVEIEKKQLLHNIDLNLKTGDLCVICGKNGAGKTTLLKTLMHHFSTKITAGTITFNRQKINLLKTSDIAHLGFFFIPQHSCELPGIQTLAFLKTLNSSLKNPLPFDQLFNHVHQTLKTLALPEDILTRNLNVNFSGGQRKKTEILQASIAHPKVWLVDEIDAGLDVDSLKHISKYLQQVRNQSIILIISHNNQFIKTLKPNKVIVLNEGKITLTGDQKIIDLIEKNGYEMLGKKTQKNNNGICNILKK